MLLIRNSLINVSDIADVKGEEKMEMSWWMQIIVGVCLIGLMIIFAKFWRGFVKRNGYNNNKDDNQSK